MAVMDENFIEEVAGIAPDFLYYSLQVMGDVQDKSDAYAALDESDVADYLNDILNELNVIVKNESVRKIDGAEAQMDTCETCCWNMQGGRGGSNPPCSCIATYGTTCGRFYY